MKMFRTILWIAVAAVTAVLAVAYFTAEEDGDVRASAALLPIDDPYLALTDHTGAPFDTRRFSGQHQLVYFGFTFCPDVCPISTTRMMAAAQLYADTAPSVPLNTVFVSIDPQRDTPQALSQFRNAMGGSLTALTGAPADIEAATETYKVYAQKRGDGEDYLYDHSDLIYWVRPDGSVGFFSTRQTPEDIAQALADARIS